MTPDEQQAIISAAEERQTRRCEAIFTSAAPGPLRDLAAFIAFETNVPAETSLAILNVARFVNIDPVTAEIVRQALAELAAHLDETMKPKKESCHE